MDISSFSITEAAGGVSVALVTIAFGIQKLLASWRVSSTETSIITLMHTELERMSAQNSLLSKELNTLQIEIVNLNKQLRELSSENQRLHNEVASLTREVGSLQTMLQKGRE